MDRLDSVVIPADAGIQNVVVGNPGFPHKTSGNRVELPLVFQAAA